MNARFYTLVIILMTVCLAFSRGQQPIPEDEAYSRYLESCNLLIEHSIAFEQGMNDGYDVSIVTLFGEVLDYSSRQGNPISLPAIAPKNITTIIITDRMTGNEFIIDEILDHAYLECPEKRMDNPPGDNARGTCGTGTIYNYFNCDGEFHDIDKSYLEPDMYVHVDDDYITCIAKVDENCQIGESFRTFCTYYPYASAGDYPLGFIHYEKVIGLEDFNAATGFAVTDRQGEEMNWILCNARDMGYSYSQMNAAIWGILDQVTCNGLCWQARDAIVAPTGQISPHLEFYVPLNGNNVQPQIRNKCVELTDMPLSYICGDEKIIDTYVKGLLDQSPSNRFIDIPDPGTVERVVAEVWVEPNQCPGDVITTSLGLRADNGSATPEEVTVNALEIIQTSSSTSIENVFRYTFEGSFGRISVLEGTDAGCDPSSIAVYVVRPEEGGAGTVHTSINREFHRSSHEFTMNVGSAPQDRDLNLKVPIHEIGNNNRIARVETWYNGSPVYSGETSSATHGLEASMVEVLLPNVPAAIENINVKIISPDNSTGESFGVGSASISSEQACCPDVSATGGTLSCVTGQLTLTSSTDMQNPAIQWTGPGGFTSTLASPVVDQAGDYTVTATEAASGCVSTATATVLSSDDGANCSAGNTGPITCASPSVFLDGESTTQGAAYQWTGPNGFTANTENTVTSQPGTYTLTVTGPDGCPSTCETTVGIDIQDYSETITDVVCAGTVYYLPDGTPVTTAGTYVLDYQAQNGCDSVITTILTVLPPASFTQTASICEGDSYTLPGGTVVTAPGTYYDTYTTANGCDSIVTTILSVWPSYDEIINAIICQGETYTLPDGTVVSAAGTYTSNHTTIHGCDSVITVNLAVQPESDIVINATICGGESYTLPDGTVTANEGTYTETFTSSAGCDSTVTVNLTVAPKYADVLSATICEGETYTLPGGTTVSTAGTYTDSLTTIFGCDSILITTIDVVPAYQTNQSASICVGAGYTMPDGTVVTTPGTYTSTLTTSGGCDSVITIDLAVVTGFDELDSVLLCQGSSYVLPSGVQTYVGGTYIDTLTANTGCDSVITTIIELAPSYVFEVRDTICDGDSYLLPSGVYVDEAGVYINFFETWQGCDSVITTYLDVLPTYLSITPITICSGESITLADGSTVNTEGYFGDTLLTVMGCDSILLTEVEILPVHDILKNIEICFGGSYTLPGGTIVSAPGTYVDSFTSSIGCDSVITTVLDMVPSFDETATPVICMGDSYFLPDGSEVFLPGTYSFSLTANGGCDSLITIILDVVPNYDEAINAAICIGDTFTLPGGNDVIASGVYIDTFQTQFGCDSIITTTLTVQEPVSLTVNAAICSGESYVLPGGNSTTTPGTYTDSLVSAGGCDSVITTVLVIEEHYADTIHAGVCPGDSYTLPDGSTVSTAGTYTHSFTTYLGCDSVITTIVTVAESTEFTVNASICVGEVYVLPDGSQTGIPGTWVDSLVSSIGCDSVITTTVGVYLPTEDTIDVEICADEIYLLPNGDTATVSGSYFYQLQNIHGCDSTIVTNLTVTDAYSLTEDIILCDGESHTLPNGGVITDAGTYIDSLTTSGGCDSVITTIVDVATGADIFIAVEICQDGFYTLPDGNVTITPGIYEFALSTIEGCDSLITIELEVVPEYRVWEDYALCEGGSITLPTGTVVTAAGVYIDSLVSFWGCDSIITSTVELYPNYQETITAGICNGLPYTLPDGSVVTDPGTYTTTLSTEFGCDSVITTILDISTGADISVDITMCDGDYYTLPGGDVTSQAGTYIDTLYSELGCDSIITTTISLLPHSYADIDLFACDADMMILESGDTVTADGEYLYVIENHLGCDSSIVATVKFSNSVDAVTDIVLCEGDPYILWSGDTIYTAGTYTDSLQTYAGCDSVVTVNIDVNPSYEIYQSDTICDEETYILPDGQIVTSAGQYYTILSTVDGCDSTIVTDIITLPSYQITNNYEICQGESIDLPNGQTVSEAGTIIESFSTTFGCDSIITYNVSVNPNTVYEFDHVVCGQASVTIGDFTYDESGTYIINSTNHFGCDSTIIMNLELNVPFEAHIDTTLCPGSSVTIAGQTFTAEGAYVVLFTNVYGCDSTYFVDIDYVNEPVVEARGDTTILQGAEVEAYMERYSLDRPLEFTWFIDDTLVHTDVERFRENYFREATVRIVVKDSMDCQSQDEFRIFVEEKCPDDLIFAPNIISPNHDNANDEFKILNPHDVYIDEVTIFNRWGEIVHTAPDFNDPWDGTFRGKDCNPDVYTYFIQGTCASGDKLLKKGNITLMR